jgi:selenocysteine lyase/cysteine desulfurase
MYCGMDFPFAKEREYFPILKQTAQLSSCSQSAMSNQVYDAVQSYLNNVRADGMDWGAWMDRVSRAKASFARLINASPDEIAVLGSVSDAASTVASALDFGGQRNKVVTTEIDFPTIGHVWLAQRKRGAEVDFIPAEMNLIPTASYERYVDNRTLVTSVPHVSYYNGFTQDLNTISAIAHAKGSYLFVDAYQSAGNVAIDVKQMDIDFLAAGTQKYLIGIPGIAFLYVRKEIAGRIEPATTGWFGRRDPFDFDVRKLDFAEGARRFDTGTPPMINAYAAHAAIELILEVGVPRIEGYLRQLSEIAVSYARDKGLRVMSPEDLGVKASNTAIQVPKASEMERLMREEGFIVSARNDVIRIAPHFYNTEEEVLTAIATLDHIRKSC